MMEVRAPLVSSRNLKGRGGGEKLLKIIYKSGGGGEKLLKIIYKSGGGGGGGERLDDRGQGTFVSCRNLKGRGGGGINKDY